MTETEASAGHRRARIGTVRIVTDGQLPYDREPELRAALVQGTKVTRYGRTWYMGKVSFGDGWATSKLGFASDGHADIWDEDLQDFLEVDVPSGTTSPFAVRLSDLTVAFQLRTGVIKVQSFAQALQALMREASEDRSWRVEPIVRQMAFSSWIETVDRVKSVRLNLRPPNPNYSGRPSVQAMIEATRATSLAIVLGATDDELDGLDINADFLRQAIDHAERGYGELSAVGERIQDGVVRLTTWDQAHAGEMDAASAPVGDAGEIQHAALEEALTSEIGGAEGGDDAADPMA